MLSSIEQSLKELQAKMGGGLTGELPASPTEILQWLSPQSISGTRPVATGHQDIMDFLKALVMHCPINCGIRTQTQINAYPDNSMQAVPFSKLQAKRTFTFKEGIYIQTSEKYRKPRCKNKDWC